MNPAQVTILYTQDADLVRKARAFLRTSAEVRHVADPDRLEPVLQQTGPAVLMMDLRAKECRDLLEQIHSEQPEILVIALGVAQSEPLREVEQLGIYAAEEIGSDRRRFQALLGRALDYHRVLRENRELRETSNPRNTEQLRRSEPTQSPGSIAKSFPLSRFPRILRRAADMDDLMASMAEGLIGLEYSHRSEKDNRTACRVESIVYPRPTN
jgi:DNA-binding NtrC family response regulator